MTIEEQNQALDKLAEEIRQSYRDIADRIRVQNGAVTLDIDGGVLLLASATIGGEVVGCGMRGKMRFPFVPDKT